jgi:dolichol-phosphate mannosyltransferase
MRRLLLSRGASLYTRIALGLPVRDTTAGYRVYRLPVLDKIEVDTVESQGYCFQIDLGWRSFKQGFRIVEVPITFAERERGASKMSGNIISEALVRVGVWGVRYRLTQLKGALGGKKPNRA